MYYYAWYFILSILYYFVLYKFLFLHIFTCIHFYIINNIKYNFTFILLQFFIIFILLLHKYNIFYFSYLSTSKFFVKSTFSFKSILFSCIFVAIM